MNNEENIKKVNWMYLVIALMVAFGIWAIASGSATADVTIKDIPVEYLKEHTTLANRGLMLLPGSDETVTLKLEGLRTAVASLDPDEVRVQVDLDSVNSTGVQNVNYRIVFPTPSSYFSANLTSVSQSSSVSVIIGAMSSKEIEVRCDISGNIASGYIAGEVQLSTEKLAIQGSAAEVDAVSYARVVLNVNNASETVVETLDYVLYDAQDKPITEHSLRVSEEKIRVTLPINIIKEIPLEIEFLEDVGSRLANTEWTLEPASITVYGDAAALIKVDRILLDTIVLAGLNGDTTFNYVIPLPEGCENLSGISRAELKLSFKDLLVKDIETRNFLCTNKPLGKVVTVLTSRLTVTLRGTSVDINSLRDSDIIVVANLSEISSASGSYTVQAEVQLDTYGDIAVIGTYQIRVNISEPPPPPEPEPLPEPGTGTEPETGGGTSSAVPSGTGSGTTGA